jgi:hypothetical protein
MIRAVTDFERQGPLIHGNDTNAKGDNYSLGIREDCPTEEYRVVVNFTPAGQKTGGYPITARDIGHYQRSYPAMPIRANMQYAEVGPGLGELIPHLVQSQRIQLEQIPIAIDPADYGLIQHLAEAALDQAHKVQLSNRSLERLSIVLNRCEVMRDASRVQLVNTTVARALNKYPDLAGAADIVVDHYGAELYPHTEDSDIEQGRGKVRSARHALLKSDGLHFA